MKRLIVDNSAKLRDKKLVNFPKKKVVRDQKYLAWCRRQRCAFCGNTRPRVEAHHVEKKGMGGATLRDDRAVPTCLYCHRRCHGETVVLDGNRLHPISLARQMHKANGTRADFLKGLDQADDMDIPW